MPDTREIKNIRSRLERWELTHLRALAASLHTRLEAAEARADEAESWANHLQRTAESLQEELMQLADEAGASVGLTQQGEIVVIPKPTAPEIAVPHLETGEHYAGIALDDNGTPSHHLVLMAQRPAEELTWQAAMDWAASVGGSLPTRQEQALLFSNCKPHLKPDWHWSSQTHENDASFAWLCNFCDGLQFYGHKSSEGCAVAVRRFVIQSFNTLDAGAQ